MFTSICNENRIEEAVYEEHNESAPSWEIIFNVEYLYFREVIASIVKFILYITYKNEIIHNYIFLNVFL